MSKVLGTVSLNSLLPRRIFLPFELVEGGNAEALFDRVKGDNKSFVLCNKPPGGICQGAHVANGDLWHPKYWTANLTCWEWTGVEGIPSELQEERPKEIELEVGIGCPKTFGLFLTWLSPRGPRGKEVPHRPQRKDVLHIVVASGLLERLRASAKGTVDQDVVDIRERTGGRPFYLLEFPFVALCPRSLYKDNGCFPWENFWDGFLNLMGIGGQRLRWTFRPRMAHLSRGAMEPEHSGFGIAIDFGTSATNVALIPINPGPGANSPSHEPVRGLAPWTHSTVVPLLDEPLNFREVHYRSEEYKPQGVLGPDIPITAAPSSMAMRRSLGGLSSSGGKSQVPSMFYIPNSGKDEEPTVVIGAEAEAFVEESLARSKGGSKGADWEKYLFSPKSLVGSEPDEYQRQGIHPPIGDQHPVETYLTELFNQIHFRVSGSGNREKALSPPLEFLTYSYPVAWTNHQRNSFQRHLVSSLDRSALSEVVKESANSVVKSGGGIDEASAAFLGFVVKRFGGLSGLELLRALQPYKPRVRAEESPVHPVNVLVFDCGEGTTDIVLLRIGLEDDRRDGKPIGPGPRVVSEVIKHYAMPKAGLEVTRRVAERLKQSMIDLRKGVVGDWIRTNLKDRDLTNNQGTKQGQTRGQYRRTMTNLLYSIAEELKIRQKLEGKERLDALLDLANVPNDLNLTLDTDTLAGIVKEVFEEPIRQMERWVKEGPRLDLVILSGRSSRLPGLYDLIHKAIPLEKRPFQMDFIKPGYFTLDSEEAGDPNETASKDVVCNGIALNAMVSRKTNSQGIHSKPIDQMLRVRAIGVMNQKYDLGMNPFFDHQFPLLVEPDNQPIRSDLELGPITLTNPENRTVELGYNFSGLSGDKDFKADAVHCTCRINIEGGKSGDFSEMRLYFKQVNSSDVELCRVETTKPGGEVVNKEVKKEFGKDGAAEGFAVTGGIKIRVEQIRLEPDFRNTGKIHVTGFNSIDRDM